MASAGGSWTGALARAREARYERIELTTFSELTVGGARSTARPASCG